MCFCLNLTVFDIVRPSFYIYMLSGMQGSRVKPPFFVSIHLSQSHFYVMCVAIHPTRLYHPKAHYTLALEKHERSTWVTLQRAAVGSNSLIVLLHCCVKQNLVSMNGGRGGGADTTVPSSISAGISTSPSALFLRGLFHVYAY